MKKVIVSIVTLVLMLSMTCTSVLASDISGSNITPQLDEQLLDKGVYQRGYVYSPWVPQYDSVKNLDGNLSYNASLYFSYQTWTSYWFYPNSRGQLEITLLADWNPLRDPDYVNNNDVNLDVIVCKGDAGSYSNHATTANFSLPRDIPMYTRTLTGLDPNTKYFVFFALNNTHNGTGNYLNGTCRIDWP